MSDVALVQVPPVSDSTITPSSSSEKRHGRRRSGSSVDLEEPSALTAVAVPLILELLSDSSLDSAATHHAAASLLAPLFASLPPASEDHVKGVEAGSEKDAFLSNLLALPSSLQGAVQGSILTLLSRRYGDRALPALSHSFVATTADAPLAQAHAVSLATTWAQLQRKADDTYASLWAGLDIVMPNVLVALCHRDKVSASC